MQKAHPGMASAAGLWQIEILTSAAQAPSNQKPPTRDSAKYHLIDQLSPNEASRPSSGSRAS
jgi:hypothetical protein